MARKLKDLDVWEVSLVDQGANDKRFLVLKQAGKIPVIKSGEGGKLKALGGLKVRAEITDDEIWGHIEKEYITAFSWYGSPRKELIDFSDNGYKVTLIEADVVDVSVVTVPGDVDALLKIVDKEKRIIEGMVATDTMNRNYYKVLPSVFEKAMAAYMEKPPKGVLFYNHDWNRPVGRILEWSVEQSQQGGGEEEIMAQFAKREERAPKPEAQEQPPAPVVKADEKPPEAQPKPPETTPAPAVKQDEEEYGDKDATKQILTKLDVLAESIKAMSEAVTALVDKMAKSEVGKAAEAAPAPPGEPKPVEKRLEDLEALVKEHLPIRKGVHTEKGEKPPEQPAKPKFEHDPKRHPGDNLRSALEAAIPEE